MNIEDRLLTINPYSRSGEKQNKIEKIVVHWVGNAGSSAIGNRNYFENYVKAYNGEEDFLVKIPEVKRVLKLMDAARLSAKTKKSVDFE